MSIVYVTKLTFPKTMVTSDMIASPQRRRWAEIPFLNEMHPTEDKKGTNIIQLE